MISKLSQSIRFSVAIKLLRFLNWAKLRIGKKAISLQRILLIYLGMQIRLQEDSFLQYGERRHDDIIIDYVIRSLTGLPYLENDFDPIMGHGKVATRIIRASETNSEIRKTVCRYFLGRAFVAKLLNKDHEEQDNLTRAQQLSPDAKPLKPDDIYRLHKQAKKTIKSAKRILAERSALKFRPTGSQLTSVLSITPAILLVAGVLYTTILLHSVGIKASLFFNVGDYLSTSLDQLQRAMFSVATSILAFFLGLRHASLRPRMVIEAQQKRMDPFSITILIMTIGAATIAAISAWRGEFDRGAISFLGTVLAYTIGDKVCESFFQPSFIIKIGISSILIFFAIATASLWQEIHDINRKNWKGREMLNIITKGDSPVNTSNLVVVGANSNYFFTVDRVTGLASAVPRDQIAEIRIRKK
ncbi:hypothetical protein [Cupriavidus alkaliphilus]|uniref:Uncharacterized protein n=1 Tax=Cupriavidus alkaliphilus TaxID=942866 RepID=A0A7W4V668_9BURK|nr:hypothetical protein [Cupriavidus alkaliphilus]MBB3005807.1 hypothetical protein [Cupriavidus alkaliphilus]